jgi:hypothetical protein
MIAVFLSTFEDYRPHLSAGERAVVLAVATATLSVAVRHSGIGSSVGRVGRWRGSGFA